MTNAATADHGRFPYSPVTDRDGRSMPGGARICVIVSPNIEHFHWGKPGMSMTPMTAGLKPDVLNHAWREYGNRVGVWRLMEILEKHRIRACAPVNSEVFDTCPKIIEEGDRLGWEWVAHGPSNSMMFTGMPKEAEKPIIQNVVEQMRARTGRTPRGWLSPALTETDSTLDLIAEAGIEYVLDWVNDELPYDIKTSAGVLSSIPYTLEIGDIPIFLHQGRSGSAFYDIVADQFDQLYEEGETRPRIMAIALHPFLIGHPFRARHLDRALAYIMGHERVWIATGSEVLDWHRQ